MSAPAAIELPTAPIGQTAVNAAVNAADAVVNEPAKIATKPDEKKVAPPANQVLDVVEFYSQFQDMEYKAGNFLLEQAKPATLRKTAVTGDEDELDVLRIEEEEQIAEKFREQQAKAVRDFRPNATLFLFLLGVMSACTSFLVDHSVTLLKKLRDYCSNTGIYAVDFTVYILVGLGFVTIAASMGQFISIDAQGSGIPEMKVLLSGVWQKNFLTLNTLIAKVIGLTFACAAGLYIGKEGPFVHLAGLVANQLLRLPWFKSIQENPSFKRQILAASVAAGVTATFGTPVGGVLFGIEVTSTFFMVYNLWRSFFSAIVAVIVFRLIRATPVINFTVMDPWPFGWTLVLFAGLGIICGLTSVMFIEWFFFLQRVKQGKPQPRWFFTWLMSGRYRYAWVMVIVISLLSFPFPAIRPGMASAANDVFLYYSLDGSSFEYINGTAVDNLAPSGTSTAVTSAMLAKVATWTSNWGGLWFNFAYWYFLLLIFVPLSMSVAVPGGVFMPSFAFGALTGRLYGALMIRLFPSFSFQAGWFAICGAAAMTSGVTRTVSGVLIVFEVTGQMYLLVPGMTTMLVAHVVASRFCPSIFDAILKMKGLPMIAWISPAEMQDGLATQAAAILKFTARARASSERATFYHERAKIELAELEAERLAALRAEQEALLASQPPAPPVDEVQDSSFTISNAFKSVRRMFRPASPPPVNLAAALTKTPQVDLEISEETQAVMKAVEQSKHEQLSAASEMAVYHASRMKSINDMPSTLRVPSSSIELHVEPPRSLRRARTLAPSSQQSNISSSHHRRHHTSFEHAGGSTTGSSSADVKMQLTVPSFSFASINSDARLPDGQGGSSTGSGLSVPGGLPTIMQSPSSERPPLSRRGTRHRSALIRAPSSTGHGEHSAPASNLHVQFQSPTGEPHHHILPPSSRGSRRHRRSETSGMGLLPVIAAETSEVSPMDGQPPSVAFNVAESTGMIPAPRSAPRSHRTRRMQSLPSPTSARQRSIDSTLIQVVAPASRTDPMALEVSSEAAPILTTAQLIAAEAVNDPVSTQSADVSIEPAASAPVVEAQHTHAHAHPHVHRHADSDSFYSDSDSDYYDDFEYEEWDSDSDLSDNGRPRRASNVDEFKPIVLSKDAEKAAEERALKVYLVNMGYLLDGDGDVASDCLFLTLKSSFFDVCELLTKREYFHIPIVKDKVSRTLVGSVPRARLEEVIALQEEMVMRTMQLDSKENYFERMFNSLVTKMGKFKEKYLIEKDDEASVSRYKYIVEWRRRALNKGLPDNEVAKRMDRLLSLPVYSTISTVIDFAPFTVAAVCPLRKIRYYFSMLSLFQVFITSEDGGLLGVIEKKNLIDFDKAKKK